MKIKSLLTMFLLSIIISGCSKNIALDDDDQTHTTIDNKPSTTNMITAVTNDAPEDNLTINEEPIVTPDVNINTSDYIIMDKNSNFVPMPPPVEAPVVKPKPTIKRNTLLSSFTTKFYDGRKSRVSNIKLASKKINGKVVNPGETFSFNTTVGPTSAARGFKEAPTITKGQKTKGYGGGVCQVSSTIFNAAEKAGLKIVERHSHSKDVPYTKKNKDAATSYGGVDFKFKNTKSYPVKIVVKVQKGSITAKIVSA